MVHFNFIAKDITRKVYERYPANLDLSGMIHKVCRNIDRKELATFSITMDGLPSTYLSYVSTEQDVLSIASELKHFITLLKNASTPKCSLFLYESFILFEFYTIDTVQIQYKFFQKDHLILERIVSRDALVENVETMFNNFSNLIKHQFPKAYKIFKAEDFVV
jgi:hypothetical protein